MFINLTQHNKHKSRKKAKKRVVQVYEKYTPKPFESYKPTATTSRRETKVYPSVMLSGPINTSRPERKEYTGTLVTGIATMHKSNAVPIINDEQAKDIARMRRG